MQDGIYKIYYFGYYYCLWRAVCPQADNGWIALYTVLLGWDASFPLSSESLGNLYGIDDMEQYHIRWIRCCSFHINYFIDCWQTLWMIGHFSSHPCFVFIQCFSLLLLHAVLYIRDGYRLNSTFLRLASRMIRSFPWHHRVLAIFME